jgi:hypothetical protein
MVASAEDVQAVKSKYHGLIRSGELERRLSRLMKKQKRATTTNGPHPHHPVLQQEASNISDPAMRSQTSSLSASG